MISSMVWGIYYFIGQAMNSIDRATEPEDDLESALNKYADDKYNQTKLDMKLIQEEVDDEFMDWDEACQWYLEQEYNERQDHEIN